MLNFLDLIGVLTAIPGDRKAAWATLIAAVVSALVAVTAALAIFVWVKQ